MGAQVKGRPARAIIIMRGLIKLLGLENTIITTRGLFMILITSQHWYIVYTASMDSSVDAEPE
jgi:hypothetical protein